MQPKYTQFLFVNHTSIKLEKIKQVNRDGMDGGDTSRGPALGPLGPDSRPQEQPSPSRSTSVLL